MSFTLECPFCKVTLEAEDKYEGKEEECPACKKKIKVVKTQFFRQKLKKTPEEPIESDVFSPTIDVGESSPDINIDSFPPNTNVDDSSPDPMPGSLWDNIKPDASRCDIIMTWILRGIIIIFVLGMGLSAAFNLTKCMISHGRKGCSYISSYFSRNKVTVSKAHNVKLTVKSRYLDLGNRTWKFPCTYEVYINDELKFSRKSKETSVTTRIKLQEGDSLRVTHSVTNGFGGIVDFGESAEITYCKIWTSLEWNTLFFLDQNDKPILASLPKIGR